MADACAALYQEVHARGREAAELLYERVVAWAGASGFLQPVQEGRLADIQLSVFTAPLGMWDWLLYEKELLLRLQRALGAEVRLVGQKLVFGPPGRTVLFMLAELQAEATELGLGERWEQEDAEGRLYVPGAASSPA